MRLYPGNMGCRNDKNKNKMKNMMENIKAKATNYVPKSIGFSEGYLYGLMKPDSGYLMMAD